MKNKALLALLSLLLLFMATACGNQQNKSAQAKAREADKMSSNTIVTGSNNEADKVKIKITAGKQSFTATLENNATTRALLAQFPLTVPMLNLYGREMCYRFAQPLPSDKLRSDSYAVGDIIYWPPRHSLVILYKQNEENFSRQHLGHVDGNVESFAAMGDLDVTFDLL